MLTSGAMAASSASASKAKRTPRIVEVDEAARAVTVRVERAVYPLEAVYGAAYELLERAWVYLAADGKRGVRVHLRVRGAGAANGAGGAGGAGVADVSAADLEALAGDFAARLLDHALRLQLARRHGKLREMIVERALYGAGAADVPDDAPGPASAAPAADDDPFGVAASWQASRAQPAGRRRS